MEIASKLFWLVVKYSRNTRGKYILLKCWTLVFQLKPKFNRINSNNSEGNEDEEKEPIDIEFAEKNSGPENDEIIIDFRR